MLGAFRACSRFKHSLLDGILKGVAKVETMVTVSSGIRWTILDIRIIIVAVAVTFLPQGASG